jgi:integrase
VAVLLALTYGLRRGEVLGLHWSAVGHWHPHELRHSGASLILAQGTPLHVVSEVLGHASIAMSDAVERCCKAKMWLAWPTRHGGLVASPNCQAIVDSRAIHYPSVCIGA